jgi:hypothetical protein
MLEAGKRMKWIEMIFLLSSSCLLTSNINVYHSNYLSNLLNFVFASNLKGSCD